MPGSVLVVVSAAYVAHDAFTRNPELTVMKWGWVLVTLYCGRCGRCGRCGPRTCLVVRIPAEV